MTNYARYTKQDRPILNKYHHPRTFRLGRLLLGFFVKCESVTLLLIIHFCPCCWFNSNRMATLLENFSVVKFYTVSWICPLFLDFLYLGWEFV